MKWQLSLITSYANDGLHQLLKILDFRHDEAMKISAANTQAILQATGRENEHMKIIAEKSQNDSRSTKILTFIMLAYLPANLIAVSYKDSQHIYIEY